MIDHKNREIGRLTRKSGAARASTDPDKEVELLITQNSAKTARPWLSPELTGSAMLSKSHQAIAPLLWIPGCMEDAVYGHLATSVLVKDGVWKSPHQCPTILLMDFSVEFRHATNCLNRSVHTAEKLFPQTRSTIFRTNNMPHRRPVVLPAQLLVQRP